MKKLDRIVEQTKPGTVGVVGLPTDEHSSLLHGAVLAPAHILPAPLVGADIVEYNPKRDPMGITAMTAAKFLKGIAAQMIAGKYQEENRDR